MGTKIRSDGLDGPGSDRTGLEELGSVGRRPLILHLKLCRQTFVVMFANISRKLNTNLTVGFTQFAHTLYTKRL
jgi:hypothetical protein